MKGHVVLTRLPEPCPPTTTRQLRRCRGDAPLEFETRHDGGVPDPGSAVEWSGGELYGMVPEAVRESAELQLTVRGFVT